MRRARDSTERDTTRQRPRVLITRPRDRQQPFADRCRAAGFDVSLLPCIEIEWSHAPTDAPQTGARLAIFTSAYAVAGAHRHWPLPWPDTPTVGIGPATCEALVRHGQNIAFETAPPYDSESMLVRLSSMPRQSPIVIIKGEGGRPLLLESLRARGHPIRSVDVYRRRRPDFDEGQIAAILDSSPIDVLSVTSNEILDNLLELIGPTRQRQFLKLPLVVNSERGARHARDRGFGAGIRVADPPGDEGQLRQLRACLRLS